MRSRGLCLTLLGLSLLGGFSKADIVFGTDSTATQTISSPLFPNGSIDLFATGRQVFTLDLAGGTAQVTSDFKGSDFLTPFGFAEYDLYNTATTGTITDNGNGTYSINYSLLFELKITSGPLAGTVFETKDNATFNSTVASLPFPANTQFGDPNRPNDSVGIYVKTNPSGLLPPVGSLVGASSNRVVTTLRTVPEPSALISGAIGAGLFGAFGLRRAARGRKA